MRDSKVSWRSNLSTAKVSCSLLRTTILIRIEKITIGKGVITQENIEHKSDGSILELGVNER